MTKKQNAENVNPVTPATRRRAMPRTRRSSDAPATETFADPAETHSFEPIAASGSYEPTRDEIARLAYSYWEARGRQGGSPEEDWLHAEKELRRGALAVV